MATDTGPGGLMLTVCFEKTGIGDSLLEVDAHPHKPWLLLISENRELHVWSYEEDKLIAVQTCGSGSYFWKAKFLAQNNWIVVASSSETAHSRNEIIVYGVVETPIVDPRKTEDVKRSQKLEEVKRLQYWSNEINYLAVDHCGPQHVLIPSVCTGGVLVYPYGRKMETPEWQGFETWDLNCDWKHTTFGNCQSLVARVVFHPLEPHICASAGYDGKINVWDVEKGSCLHTLEGNDPISSLQFSPDGRKSLLIAGHPYGWVQIWDYRQNKRVVQFRAHECSVVEAFLHPHLPYIFSASSDGTIRVWDPSSYTLVRSCCTSSLKSLSSMALCWNTGGIAVGGKGAVAVMKIDISNTHLREVLRMGEESARQRREVEIARQKWEKGLRKLKAEHESKARVYAKKIKELMAAVNDLTAERNALKEILGHPSAEHENKERMQAKTMKRCRKEGGDRTTDRDTFKNFQASEQSATEEREEKDQIRAKKFKTV
ncbi:hypothetical protein CBR_g36751 [Chara braunii]|uniref:Uncharacterized protein n=1 Tax=Chara braunii TaxID=69332 RepID=A0A388LLL9_CHABU|nr:hypothetical protein CBR_g36751 [Chara braunii]|eukprot:GBG83133.1 hypothetical protein CBR_g36751 [Chara braunii]